MSLTVRILIGLGLGLALGILGAATQHPALLALKPIIEPIGTVWLNALRMTIIPLVVSLLVTSIASASEAAGAGRASARAVLVIAAMLCGAAAFTAIVAPALMAIFPVDVETAARLTSSVAGDSGATPATLPLSQWFIDIIPANPIKAAADGAMLSVVVFALLLGFATARLGAESRAALVGFFSALGEALMLIVHWVLVLAPIGVFALVLPVAMNAGVGIVGALGHYVVLLVVLCVLVTLLVYPATRVFAGVPIAQFAEAVAPAQAVAFSTRSSLASLPAMLEGAKTRLGVPGVVAGLVLPLAVSLMRITSPVVNLASAIFVANLYDIRLSPLTIAVGAFVAVVTNLGAVGLPGHVSFMAARLPVALAMGVPVEILALLIAVDVIPDTFQTVGNVTADVAAAAIVNERSRA
jgi:Na+/H+-dicarboxylate symporter